MLYNTTLEAEVIRRFVLESKRDRYLQFVSSSKNRQKFINELHHMNFLRFELFDKVIGYEHAFVKDRLRILSGIHMCYIISEMKHIDGQTLPVDEALNKVYGTDSGSLLVFGDAEIVYVEAEGFNHRWLSKLPQYLT